MRTEFQKILDEIVKFNCQTAPPFSISGIKRQLEESNTKECPVFYFKTNDNKRYALDMIVVDRSKALKEINSFIKINGVWVDYEI